MSTRSLICKKELNKDNYRTIYCHSDGYLTYNGAMLLDHYKTPEIVDELLNLGNLSCLNEHINPNPLKPHSFDYANRQDDVCVAYGRDRGEAEQEAKIYTMKELKEEGWIEYVYIFDEDNKWKYMEYPFDEIKDVETELNKQYGNLGIRKPKNFYGFFTDSTIEKIKAEQAIENEDSNFIINSLLTVLEAEIKEKLIYARDLNTEDKFYCVKDTDIIKLIKELREKHK